MANRKISDLTALTAPATGDLLPIVDISEAVAADKNKKITYGELLSSAPAGSAAAPSFSFDGDPNSGLYSAGADQVAISTGGSGRLFVDASGNVGVGTIPSQSLHVTSTSNGTTARFENNSGNFIDFYETTGGTRLGYLGSLDNTNWTVHNDKNGYLAFDTNNSERLRITSAGLVGVGTSSPSAKFVVSNNGANGIEFFPELYTDTNAIASFNRSTSSYKSLRFECLDYAFLTGATTAVSIHSSGRVGIGNSSPGANLDIYTSASRYVRAFPSSGLADFEVLSNNNSQPVFAIKGTGTADLFRAFANTTQAVTIKSSGNVGIGTSSPQNALHAYHATDNGVLRIESGDEYVHIEFKDPTTTNIPYIGAQGDNLRMITGGAAAVTIDSSQRVGIGNTVPGSFNSSANNLVVGTGSGNEGITIYGASNGQSRIDFKDSADTAETGILYYAHASDAMIVHTAGSERVRVTSDGKFLVGTSSALTGNRSQYSQVAVVGNSSGSGHGVLSVSSFLTGTGVTNNSEVSQITLGCTNADFAWIQAFADGTPASGSYPGRLTFSTTADGASSPTERMRISNSGIITNKTTNIGGIAGNGFSFSPAGWGMFTTTSEEVFYVNRQTNDGVIVSIRQDGNEEGTISVSGTTVSYNGAHLSRWSQLPSGAERIEILRGSVLSNLDEMCEWGDEDNEQLNRMKVSDVEGDKNVSGVFQCWDDDDDTYTNDFYCAMTGDFIIRIGAGTTVERGDLLMSAGDGTAKPQDDDIIRSKTIAKVTSTNVSCTYNDGSYCVPCVLMAC